MKPKLKPLGSKRWKLKCDVLLSNIAFKFNLRRYTAGVAAKAAGSWRGDAKDPEFKLTMIERIYEYAAGGVSKRWAAAAAEAAAAAAAAAAATAAAEAEAEAALAKEAEPKKRGRPPKVRATEAGAPATFKRDLPFSVPAADEVDTEKTSGGGAPDESLGGEEHPLAAARAAALLARFSGGGWAMTPHEMVQVNTPRIACA